MPGDSLIVRGAREHNLKGIDVTIPRDRLTVITGLSGSGKSSLAFDTIFAEGQRRYVESLSAYARQFLGLMEKPDVDVIRRPPGRTRAPRSARLRRSTTTSASCTRAPGPRTARSVVVGSRGRPRRRSPMSSSAGPRGRASRSSRRSSAVERGSSATSSRTPVSGASFAPSSTAPSSSSRIRRSSTAA